MPKSKETLCRTLVKTIGWRTTATTITIVSTWFISGSVEDALKVGAVDIIFKLSGHFAYEKLWSYCSWGYIDSVQDVENGGVQNVENGGVQDVENGGVQNVENGGVQNVENGGVQDVWQ